MKFKIWYIPQIPGSAFERNYDNLLDAVKALKLLTQFSVFEYTNRIKPDYADAGGIVYLHPAEQEWYDVLAEDLEYDTKLRSELDADELWEAHRGLLEEVLR